jgi:hypothetical protein
VRRRPPRDHVVDGDQPHPHLRRGPLRPAQRAAGHLQAQRLPGLHPRDDAVPPGRDLRQPPPPRAGERAQQPAEAAVQDVGVRGDPAAQERPGGRAQGAGPGGGPDPERPVQGGGAQDRPSQAGEAAVEAGLGDRGAEDQGRGVGQPEPDLVGPADEQVDGEAAQRGARREQEALSPVPFINRFLLLAIDSDASNLLLVICRKNRNL